MRTISLIMILSFLSLAGCSASPHHFKVDNGKVDLFLEAEGAGQVLFASSLDGFKMHKAVKDGDATWKVTMPADREFSYFYLVDGAAHPTPCELKETDDFGSSNCIFNPGL